MMTRRFFPKVQAFFLGIVSIGFLLTQTLPVSAHPGHAGHSEKPSVLIEVFERDDCQHCQDLRAFLLDFQSRTDTPKLEIVSYDIRTEMGAKAFDQITTKAKLTQSTPIVLIGTRVIQGFDTAETTGVMLEKRIREALGAPRVGLTTYLTLSESAVEEGGATCTTEGCVLPQEPLLVKIPFFGVIDVTHFSLPVLAGVLGLIDGFNPCAMWVLVTFLLVLIQMQSRERLLMVAGLFIVAETVMYYLILNVWFTTWDFVGLDQWVTPIVGLLAFGGGVFFLYEWYTSDGTCKVVNLEERAKISGRIKKLATEPFTWFTAVGVIMLAFSVNIIEFACSIGIPQAFTKILEMNELSFLGTQGLMSIYIIGYMIDDFLVFGLALWGAEKMHMTAKYSKWSNLVGGILMLILGGILIFVPDWLRLL
jgi:cytochrome c biogenesis protein CcdA